ncbi:hypothetical protein IF1G_09642 [Cordyceps javanica]|uniref:Uncharacterized protein n=1 Tax=Cordyceps javanica TaxID=43265 RepID=A0A545UQ24_9HYPO|nr:hypothetical protein IF1G_09642 [Cordyceps javanica]TQW03638.1 hypothetical protein IF2G_08936 [Cordyceps javanica]
MPAPNCTFAKWKLSLTWFKLDSDAASHYSLLFSKNQGLTAFKVCADLIGTEYRSKCFKDWSVDADDPFNRAFVKGEYQLCELEGGFSQEELLEVLAEVRMPFFAAQNQCISGKWVSEALLKLNVQSIITHSQWCTAHDILRRARKMYST